MTKLLEEAFTTISKKLNLQDQNRLAHLMIENVGKLHELLGDEIHEQNFDNAAVEVIESGKVQNLLKKVANKYNSQILSNDLR